MAILQNVDRERCDRLEQELTAAKAALQTSLARTADLQAQLQQYKYILLTNHKLILVIELCTMNVILDYKPLYYNTIHQQIVKQKNVHNFLFFFLTGI